MSAGPKSTTPDGNDKNLPLWREHFPIDTDKESSRARREFLGGLTVAGAAMACGQVALQTVSPQKESGSPGDESENQEREHVVLEKTLGEMETGEAQLFHFPDHRSPCILIKQSSTEFVAYAQKCTHLACPVIPNDDHETLHCPCHHGSFDLATGKPIAGPPRSSLPKVKVVVGQGGTLTAVGIG